MIHSIPLNKLRLSDRNVRKTNRTEGIESLAEDIASRGLKQNLVVTESREKPGLYEVDAGGRRFLALQKLSAEKRIPKNWPVPCLIEKWEQAHETSLAENLHRVAMNPADEFEAFAQVIADYADSGITDEAERISNCAKRFGVTARLVQQRLRLAALAPAVLAALRDGRISIESAKAYAGHPDQALQLKIFEAEEKKGSWGHSVQAIKNQIAGKIYTLDDRRVVYVGLEAYRQAGGRLEPDLFLGTDAPDVLLDPHVVDELLKKKADVEAGKLAQAAGWADGMFNGSTSSYGQVKPPEGFTSGWIGNQDPPAEQRDQSIALYFLNDDAQLERAQYCLIKAEPVKPVDHAGLAALRNQAWLEEKRQAAIAWHAARLAAPQVSGTPLEGRAFWPAYPDDYLEPIAKDEDGSWVIALLVKVPAEEVEARRAEGEAAYQAEQERIAAEEAAETAASVAAEPDGACESELDGEAPDGADQPAETAGEAVPA